MARADRLTITQKKPVLYSDFTINLDRNPLTGLLARVENEDAVMNSIRNLCRTRRRERFNQPNLGSKADSNLFDPADPKTANLIVQDLQDTIKNEEPRVRDVTFKLTFLPDSDLYRVDVLFTTLNNPEQTSFSFTLDRVR